ncbi:MAG: DUF2110 family protein [Candidatus Bathyarchaeota archaeon]|nr:MAG: DUF2110 family protein [Candidatus Bathyarchaeota archaeon]
MPTVTLLQKAYGLFPSKAFEPLVMSLCKGLNVRLEVVGGTDRGWIKALVSGEDEAVALRLLDREIGLAPASADMLKKFLTVKGSVLSFDRNEEELVVDIGVFSPNTCDAYTPLQCLRAQLADGKMLSFKQLTELFCLCENLPVEIKVVGDVDADGKPVEAMFSEGQLSQFSVWVRSSLDRLIVLGVPLGKVEHAVRVSRHARDVIRVQSLGLLEHAILCKLGTDARGLVPKLGALLPDAVLEPFSPRKIRAVVGSYI